VKSLKISLSFSLIIILSSFFIENIKTFIKTALGHDIVNYTVFGLLIPFFVIVFIKVLLKKNDEKATTILIIIGIILYFFIIKAHTDLITKLSLFQYITLGVFFSFENKKQSFLPILLILITSIFVELAIHKTLSISFYYYNIFINTLMGFSGYIATTIAFRR